ncbi:MAG: dienelactone hydrolase family protein [Chthoniobacterales bacterium]|nr:dienelactone hydrolase family protein [Chthoniobacterales bacterium]
MNHTQYDSGNSGVLEEFTRTAHVPILGNGNSLIADWTMPANARGVVLFAHGSGSGRQSSRNRAVARYLVSRSIGTFLMDLLSIEEERIDNVTRHLRFDIPLLAKRLELATHWIRSQPESRDLPLGYFGASTGAAAALVAAAKLQDEISAVVSRGGRPDLAGSALADVTAPTLLIVGGRDPEVEDLNRQALARLTCNRKLSIVPGATHLFEESGTLDQVQLLAANWFLKQFPVPEPITMNKGGDFR